MALPVLGLVYTPAWEPAWVLACTPGEVLDGIPVLGLVWEHFCRPCVELAWGSAKH